MSDTWRGDADVRNITIYKGEDIDIAGKLRRVLYSEETGRVVGYEPWIPPDGSTVFFRAFRSAAGGGELDILCTLDENEFAVHIENTVLDTFDDGMAFWFFVKTPETTGGNPKVATVGTVARVDPA